MLSIRMFFVFKANTNRKVNTVKDDGNDVYQISVVPVPDRSTF